MRSIVAVTVGILSMIQIAGAMDVGNSVSATPMLTTKAEVFYEKYKRDVTYRAGTGYTFSTAHDENRIIVRFKYTGIPLLNLDIGMTESKDSEGYVPMFGVGLSRDVYSQNDITMSLFAKATYVTEIEYKSSSTDYGSSYYFTYIAETYDYKLTETYWEYGVGFQLSKLWQLRGGSQLNTYGGVLASLINSDGKFYLEYYNLTRGRFTGNLYYDYDSAEIGVDFEEDKPVGAFLGMVLGFANSPFSLRGEARLINQTSFSLSAGMDF